MLVFGVVNLGFTLARIRQVINIYICIYAYDYVNLETHAIQAACIYSPTLKTQTRIHPLYIVIQGNRGLEPYAFCIIAIANLQSNMSSPSEFACQPGQDVTAEQLLKKIYIYLYIYMYPGGAHNKIQGCSQQNPLSTPRGKLRDRN